MNNQAFLVRTKGPDAGSVIAVYDNEYSANEHVKALEESVKMLNSHVERLQKTFGEYEWTEASLTDLEYQHADERHHKLGGFCWYDEFMIEPFALQHYFNRHR